jgi:hypothetical protein
VADAGDLRWVDGDSTADFAITVQSATALVATDFAL